MVPDVKAAVLPVGGAENDDDEEYDVVKVALSREFETHWGESSLLCWRVVDEDDDEDEDDDDSNGRLVDEEDTGG